MTSTLKHDDYMRERLADVTFAAEYLQAALDEGEPSVLLLALRRVAEARGGIARLAGATGLAREALYRTLSKTGNPRLTSLAAILGATGFKLAIVPARPEKRLRHRARSARGSVKSARAADLG